VKRPSKHQADTDLRGRVRRVPQEEVGNPIKGRFMDGPLAGVTRDVPRGADYIKVGPFVYSYAGKDGRTPLYCRLPITRVDRKVLMLLIAKRGKDPRVEIAALKRTPHKRTAPPAAGRGRRRREAARVTATA
jgi:hypothetical protein